MKDFNIEFESLKESYEIECKAAQGRDGMGELPKDFWESYSAMANTEGGRIFLGVSEKERQFTVLGIKNSEKVIKELTDTANNRDKVSVNLISNSDVILLEEEGGTLIEVTVRRATRQERPVYLKKNPLGNSYRRRHEADQRMTDEEVKRMLADQQYDSLDHRILKGFGMDDLDEVSLLAFRQSVAIRSPEANFESLSEMEFLKQVGGWKKDRETGVEGLTVAGLLMFGTYATIKDEFPHYFIDYQERPEAKTEQRYVDRICPDNTWSGNLYDFYRKVYPKLVSDLKVGFQLKDGIREGESPAHVAVREAFVNALVHSDYSVPTSLLVVKRPDLFGFKNPGLMRVPFDVAMSGGESDSRNKNIQDMFRMIGAGERQGFGVRKIVEGWKKFDWRKPQFEVIEESSPRVIVRLSMLSLMPEQAVTYLKLRHSRHWNKISQLQKLALVLAYTERVVTHQRLGQFSSDHSRDISDALQDLENKGVLSSSGQYRAKTYHLPEQEMPNPDDVFGSPLISEINLSDLEDSSPNLEGSSSNLEGSSPNLEGSSPNLDEFGRITHPQFDHPLIDGLDEIDKSFLDNLYEIAEEPRTKKKIPRDKMINVILILCKDQFISLNALSEIVMRDPETLRGQYLTRLKNEEKLQMAFPRKPNDPRQAYISEK